MVTSKKINILITGVGGQGVLLISQLIGAIAAKTGWKVRISEDIGQAQRGGPVVSNIRLGEGVYAPTIPRNTVDLLIGFEPLETYRHTVYFLRPGGSIVFNTRSIYPSWDPREKLSYPPVASMEEMMRKIARRVITLDANELARAAGNLLAVNMVMLGAAAAITLPFSERDIKATISETVSGNTASNLKAFEYGLKAAQGQM